MAKKRQFLKKREYYFYKFPKTTYTLGDTEEFEIETDVLNFLHRWAFRSSVKNELNAFSKWIIRDQDSIFSIAETLYGSQHYYWIIMMMNDMMDPRFEWPFNETDLYNYIKLKYGIENIYDIHHYESDDDENIFALPTGMIVTDNYAYNKKTVNNYEYEALINENKRHIKLLRPEYLEKVKREKNDILSTKFETV